MHSNATAGLFILAVFVGMVLFQGWIGYLIGRGKGRGTAGFWWSAGLGVIGWIVTAFLAPSFEVQMERRRRELVMERSLREAGPWG